jgi:hypothetical protein
MTEFRLQQQDATCWLARGQLPLLRLLLGEQLQHTPFNLAAYLQDILSVGLLLLLPLLSAGLLLPTFAST